MLNILVIDDSEVIRRLLSDYLSELGYTVEVAVDGLDGIDKALKNDYRAVFCDMHMPKKNGYEVYTTVSAEKPQLPFIMTDSLPDHLAEMAQRSGARACLRKPFDLVEVRKTIEEILTSVKTS
jgi:CheY-like chemotaxis protein